MSVPGRQLSDLEAIVPAWMGASQSTTKVPPESDVDYFFEAAYMWQGAQGGTHEGHSSNSCPPTSSADTASQSKDTLIGLKEQLPNQCQTIREVQTLRESQTMTERQTMRVGQPTTVTPTGTQGTSGTQGSALFHLRPLPLLSTRPVELPLYREMAGVCDHFDTLTYAEMCELKKNIFPKRPREEHYQAACSIEKSVYERMSCRYCGRRFMFGNSLKILVGHAVKTEHLNKVHITGRLVPRKDFEFWRDIIIRAEQLRLEEIEKMDDEQKLETTVVASCPVPEPEPNTPTVPVPEPGANTPTQSPVSELTVSKQKTNTDFFYRDAKGDMHGAFQEEQMQEWYRKGYFDSKILIGIGQKEQLVPFSALLAQNGSSTPFAYAKKNTSMSESHAVLTHRPWYLIPMLHPIAVPSQMLVIGEKLVDEVEKLREKFRSRNKDSLDDVLSHLLTRSMNCELCSTTVFNSRSEFVAHILSRQHHEELWESLSGITKHDFDYWNYVLDLARPSDGPNEIHNRMLLNGRLRDEDGKMLFRQTVNTEPVPGACQSTAQKNLANEAQAVPSEGPKDSMQVQKPTSTVQPVQTWSSAVNENPKNIVTFTATDSRRQKKNAASLQSVPQVMKDDMTNNSSSQKLGKKAETRKTRAQQYRDRQHPQVPTTVPFFKLTITGPELTREAATSACATLRGLFFRLSLEQMVEATMALLPRALTLCDFVGCPICEVPLQLGQSFMNHVLGKKHTAELYTKNGAITQGDVDFYTKTIQECMK